MGTMVVTPLSGNLSDECGRKTLLTLPLTAAIFPLDNVPESRRASTFGLLSGISSAAFVCGTFTARFLSTSSLFQVAASVSVLAAIYMRLFLPESNIYLSSSEKVPLLTMKVNYGGIPGANDSQKKQMFSRGSSLEDITCLLRSSTRFLRAAIVAFFNSLSETGFQASLLFYLKAQFHFNKNQYADLMLIAGIAGTISQLLLMPLLAPFIGEQKLLSLGLFASWTHLSLYGLAWSPWVPYVASMFTIVAVFTAPCIRSIASKQVGTDEQGKAQGCISGICSVSSIISPLAFTPLTALFLSERAPFHFPGFSIFCTSLASMVAFFVSIMIKATPPILPDKVINTRHVLA